MAVGIFPQKKNQGIQATLRRLSEYPEMLYLRLFTLFTSVPLTAILLTPHAVKPGNALTYAHAISSMCFNTFVLNLVFLTLFDNRHTVSTLFQSQPVYASSALLVKFCFASHSSSSLFSGISILSILNTTGLVPSLQQAIIIRSSFVQPCIIEPPCNAV